MNYIFHQHIKNPNSSKLVLYLATLLFNINDRLLKSNQIKSFSWELIKCELFFIDGNCIHSGNCCKNMMLIKKGIFIDTKEKFKNLISKEPFYKKFVPFFSKREKINYFFCKSLTNENTCDDYHNRPLFCRNYPFSNLLQDYPIFETCGYKVSVKNSSFKTKNKSLNQLISAVYKLHKL